MADDIPVPHHPEPPGGTADGLAQVEGFTSDWDNDPFDLDYVVWATLLHTA